MKIRLLLNLLLLAVPSFFVADQAKPVSGSFESPEAVLQHIYSSYRPWTGKDVDKNKIFDEQLLELVRHDDICSKAEPGIGALDFDPFLDSQAFDEEGISKPVPHAIGTGDTIVYEVTFQLFPRLAESRERKLVYTFARSGKTYRVADIAYSDGRSLRKLLSQPCAADAGSAIHVSRSLRPHDLMESLFPHWNESVRRSVKLLAGKLIHDGTNSTTEARERDFYIEPAEVVRLGEDRAVLITTAKEADGREEYFLLSAFWFKRNGEAWVVDRRQDQVDWTDNGHHGDVGQMRITLVNHNFVMTIQNHGSWGGAYSDWISLYSLSNQVVTRLAPISIMISVRNDSEFCEGVLKTLSDKPTPKTFDYRACYDVSGTWSFDKGSGNLIVDFVSEKEERVARASAGSDHIKSMENVDADGDFHGYATLRRQTGRAVYAPAYGKYQLIKGKNLAEEL